MLLKALALAGLACAQAPSPTTTGGGAIPTLIDGWYFVRAVAEPNYHSYLQSKPTAAPGADAYLDGPLAAGFYNIIDDQLVYHSEGGADLYLHVEQPEDLTQRKLRVWFEEEPNTWGAFTFQGDTVTWSVAEIQRPNTAAWLVCEEQQLFINTGAYGYETPAGCADQTIHSYGGSTPDV